MWNFHCACAVRHKVHARNSRRTRVYLPSHCSRHHSKASTAVLCWIFWQEKAYLISRFFNNQSAFFLCVCWLWLFVMLENNFGTFCYFFCFSRTLFTMFLLYLLFSVTRIKCSKMKSRLSGSENRVLFQQKQNRDKISVPQSCGCDSNSKKKQF